MEILASILSLIGLMYFAYKGVNVLILAPIMALLACLFHENTPLLASYTQIFMPALGSYLLKYFPIFMLGSIFGKIMSDSGAATSIGQYIAHKIGSKRAILAIVLSCALLTYGGVSLFVVAFCIYPIAVALFQAADIPKRLIPGSIALGSFTFTMTALPGTPAIQNAIPMPFFATTSFAAPLLGFIGAAVMFFAGLLWLQNRAKRAKKNNEGYHQSKEINEIKTSSEKENLPSIYKALIPLILVLVINYLFSQYIMPNLNTDFLASEKFGNTSLQKLIGLWSLIASMAIAVIVLFLTVRKYLSKPLETINNGTMGSLLPIFNTASEVGYGATIASLASFTVIKNSVVGITPNYPLVSEAISINILAGITGSASGGLSIALNALGDTYLQLATQANISPEVLHRVAAMASGGFDTLPHNGAVITLLAICGLTHRQSYIDIFMVAVIFPVLATITVVGIGSFI